jgi:uncharacterized protein (DUF58 family)
MQISKQRPELILQRLDWTVIRRLDGILQGDYRTLFHGFGLDLADLREYQFTDDVRYIDWNVTARMQTPYVRLYNEDRDITAWFLLDLSPSIDFGTVNLMKRDLLVNFVTVIARLLTRHGNQVGTILYNGKTMMAVPQGNNKAHLLRMIKTILTQPHLKNSPPTDLSVLLQNGLNTIKRRSLVFIISDFFSLPGWEKPLGMLAQRNEVLAIRLSDPHEVELPEIGTVVVEDAESGEQLLIDTGSKGFQKRFREAARKREYLINMAFRRNGIDNIELSTEDDLVAEILRFAILRKQRKSNPSSAARQNISPPVII